MADAVSVVVKHAMTSAAMLQCVHIFMAKQVSLGAGSLAALCTAVFVNQTAFSQM